MGDREDLTEEEWVANISFIEAADAWAKESCGEQGLGVEVHDPAVIRRAAAILTGYRPSDAPDGPDT